MIRVYVIDASKLLAEALSTSLGRLPEVEVVGSSEPSDEALRRLARQDADVVLVSVGANLPVSLAVVARLHEARPSLNLLPIGLRSEQDVVPFLEVGASGYVLCDAGFEELVRTIRAVHRGEPPCSPRVVASVCARIEELARQRSLRRKLSDVNLTTREQEVLEHMASGLLNKEIAGCLEISVATVKNHVHHILVKMGAPGRREAIRRAYLGGLLLAPTPRRGAARLWQTVVGAGPTVTRSNGARPT